MNRYGRRMDQSLKIGLGLTPFVIDIVLIVRFKG
jgi:hypothetical protein